MASRPTIDLVDNPTAVGTVEPPAPTVEEHDSAQKQEALQREQPRRRRTVAATTPVRPPGPAPQETNPFARQRKVQAPIRLFPPLWDRLDQLVRELREEGLEVDKTALLNATLHFYGPADIEAARDLVNRWRALLARPPAPRNS